MKDDIGETTNVAEQHPEIAGELASSLIVFQKDVDENSLTPPVNTAEKKRRSGESDKKRKRE